MKNCFFTFAFLLGFGGEIHAQPASQPESTAAIATPPASPVAEAAPGQSASELMTRFDLNHDGVLNEAELTLALASRGGLSGNVRVAAGRLANANGPSGAQNPDEAQPGQRGGQSQRRGQPGQDGQPGDLAQNDQNSDGQGGGTGQQPGQRSGSDQRGQRGGQRGISPNDLAQGDQNPDAQQPGQAGAGGQQSGQRSSGPGGQRGPNGQRGGGQGNQPGQQTNQGADQLTQNGQRQGGNGGGNLAPAASAFDDLNLLTQDLGNLDPTLGPITGENYAQWADRLRTVEQLIDDPNLRQQVATIRGRADDLRRAFQRTATPPKWGDVQNNVLVPLNQVRAEIAKELTRRMQPDTLQPADRDPVPAKFADAVSSYFEALGAAK